MARPTDRDLLSLGPYPRGGNNFATENSVPRGSFRRGVNIEVYPGGKVRRRKGYTQVDDTASRNGWSDGAYAMCTSYDGTVLRKFVPGQELVDLHTGFREDADITYCSVNDLIYVSDGETALRVNTNDDGARAWGVPCPAGQPQLSAVSGGLFAGAYQVAAIYVADDREEGGVMQASTITVGDNAGIRVVMPAYPVPSFVEQIYIFVTPPGGSEFWLHSRVPVGAVDFTIASVKQGRPLYTMGAQPMPAGELSAHNGGRFCVAVGNLLVYSLPLHYGLTDYDTNYIPYNGKLTMIAPVSPGAASLGMFVATASRTFFLSGNDMPNASNQLAYHGGAVRGAPVYIHGDEFGIENLPSQPLPMWLSSSGVPILGLPNGQVLALTNGRYNTQVGDRVSIAQRELAGISQAVIAVRSPRIGSAGVTGDSASSVLIRNGIELP